MGRFERVVYLVFAIAAGMTIDAVAEKTAGSLFGSAGPG